MSRKAEPFRCQPLGETAWQIDPERHLDLSGRYGPRLYPDLGHDLVPGPVHWLETLHISGDNLHLRQDHGEIILHRRMVFEPGPAHQIPPRTRKRT